MTTFDHRTSENHRRSGSDIEAGPAPIVQRHKDLLVDYLFQMTGSKDRAVEISLQTATMLRRPKTLRRARTDPRFWLLQEATGRILRLERMERLLRMILPWKRRRPHRPVFEQGITPGGGVTAWELMEQEREVREALAMVRPKLRRLLVLRDIIGIPADEVAHLTGLPLHELQDRLDRGRLEFRAAISGTREDR